MDRPPPCKFFSVGACFKGDLCEFTHPTQRCTSFDAGFCPYGVKCHFRHDIGKFLTSDTLEFPAPKICSFFLAGQCKYGDTCAYSHQIEDMEASNRMTLSEYKAQREQMRLLCPKPTEVSLQPETKRSSVIAPNPARPPVSRPMARLEQAFIRDLRPGDLEKMRDLEIDRLLKLYSPSVLKQTSSNSEKTKIFSLLFSPKDPDWSFEIQRVLLSITLPADYPQSPPILKVPRTSDIPDSITETLNGVITDYVTERHRGYESTGRVGLYLRSFFFWFDKALKEVFSNADAKIVDTSAEASVDLRIPESFDSQEIMVNPSTIKNQPSVKTPVPDEREKDIEADFHPEEADIKEDVAEEEEEISSVVNVQLQEISLEGLEMRGQSGTCLFTRLPVQCICSICKLDFDWTFRLPTYNVGEEDTESDTSPKPRSLTSLPPNATTCQRCRHILGLSFVAEYVHSFGFRIGTFEMANCILVELYSRTSDVMVSCTNCNGGEVKLSGIQPDRVTAKRCQKCHAVCGIFYTGVTISKPKLASANICRRFTSMVANMAMKAPTKPKRNQATQPHKPVLIQKGTPLPNNGTCRHYAKSFRWLKFPCCQRAFPCDICHDDEVAGAHETLHANRTICGFCSNEQSTQSCSSAVICNFCKKSMIASSSSHWEGGRGCRDPVKMSRKDNRKYRGR
ncbi:hypothetical protein Aperf_G00000103385 [Anoplocephala perfoliata]